MHRAPSILRYHARALRTLALALLVSAAGSARALAQQPKLERASSLSSEAQATVITKVIKMLEETYVFPQVATECGVRLNALLEKGAFEAPADAEAFGARLTEVLREVSHDKHLLVRMRRRQVQTPQDSPASKPESLPLRQRIRRGEHARQQNHGFEKVERLDGNVGYLDLRYFASPGRAMTTATAAMGFLANTDALIFDMRQNGGGHPGMVHFLSSYLFEKPTHLNSFYYREGDRTEEFWTLPGVPGPRMIDVPVFVLTSATTFSGAEEFSYNLKTQGRGTIVGEVTRGGANPGDLIPIDETFEIFIPIGRAINPITGSNWEGTGVQPDVEVPAKEALKEALELARPAAEARRARVEARWNALDAAHAKALRLDDEKRPEEAAASLTAGLRAAHGADLIGEAELGEIEALLAAEKRHALAAATQALHLGLYPK